MNPQTATMPAPAVVAPQPPSPAPAPVTSVSGGPNIVTNIPVHTQQVSPAHDDAELDKIMHDVGQELKNEPPKAQKHGLLDFLHHDPKPLVKVNNQPKPAMPAAMPATTPVAVQAAPSQAMPIAVNTPAAIPAVPAAMAQAQPQPKAAKPKTQRHIPVFVIFVALCVTGFLVAAAIAAYRQT